MKSEYKRIEIPLGWRCNISCFFCSELEDFKDKKNTSLSFEQFAKYLIEAHHNWYNHLTIVGWEPTIEQNFFKGIKLARKLWMWVQISTNCIRFIDENFTKETLEYVNWITLSIHAIHDDLYEKLVWVRINNLQNFLKKVFDNINKNYSNNDLRINYVLNSYNYRSEQIEEVFNFINSNLNNICWYTITYPDVVATDIMYDDAWNILVPLKEIKKELDKLNLPKGIEEKLVFANLPFCGMPEKFWKYQEDQTYDKDNISKVQITKWEKYQYDRNLILPRNREKLEICQKCTMSDKCWWLPPFYYGYHKNIDIDPIL